MSIKPRTKKLILSLGLLLTAFLIFFLLMEVILSRFSHLKKDEKKISVTLEGNSAHCYTSDKNHYFPIILKDPKRNKILYCVEYDARKRERGFYPERKAHFVIVGDSFTFGEGIKEKDTLGYLLGSSFPDIDFKNRGKVGANIKDIYTIVLEIRKYEKNIKHIIYFYNLNDALMSEEIARQQKYIIDFQNIRWFNVKKNPNFFTRLLSHSLLYCLFEKAVILNKESKATIANYLDMYSDIKNTIGLKQTLDLLIAMNEALKSSQIEFSVVIYPLLYKNIFGKYPFSPVHKLLLNFCDDHSLRCVDASAAFDAYYSLKKFTVHAIDFHPNGKANRLVADYLKSLNLF